MKSPISCHSKIMKKLPELLSMWKVVMVTGAGSSLSLMTPCRSMSTLQRRYRNPARTVNVQSAVEPHGDITHIGAEPTECRGRIL